MTTAVQTTEPTALNDEAKIEIGGGDDGDADDGVRLQPDKRPGLVRDAAEVNVGYRARNVMLLVKIFLFLDGCTHNGLTHLVNVYLVAIVGWTPLEASWIWFTRDLVKFLSEAYAGALVDKTEYKKAILSAIAVCKIVAGVIMVTTTAVVPQIIKGALDGIITSFVVPATTALTLGVVGKTQFHRKHAQTNIMVKNLGVTFSAIILGAVAWAIFPNLGDVFYQFIVVGALCLVCVLLMPPKEVVDHRVARGQSVRGGKDHWRHRTNRSLVPKRDSWLDWKDSESEDEQDEASPVASPVDHSSKKAEEGGSNQNQPETVEEYTEVVSLRDMFAVPGRRSSIIFLALTFFSFHLVNATVLPLLGQYIGTEEVSHDNVRSVLPSMAGLIVAKELGSFFTNWCIKSRLSKKMYSNILQFGCIVLLVRLILISVLIQYTDNLWALGSTNLLEGVAIGCLDLVLALYSHLLSRQTGHFNFNMGIISTFKTLGSALSVVIGGALATETNYNLAFPILAGMVVFPLFFGTRVHTPNLYGRVSG